MIVFYSPTNPLKDVKLMRRGVGLELVEVKHEFTNEDSNFLIIDLQASADNFYFSFALPSTLPNNELFFTVFSVLTAVSKSDGLQGLLSDVFMDEKKVLEWNSEFTDTSLLMASSFFSQETCKELVKDLAALESSKLSYLGPADYRHFSRVNINEMHSFSRLHALLTGSLLSDHIRKISGLRLTGLLQLDVRRITAGSYQIFNDRYTEPYGLDLVITLVSKEGNGVDRMTQDGGQWLYLVEGEEVARIAPRHNHFALAYRVDKCHRFMPLICPSAGNVEIYQILATFRVSDEVNP